LVFPGITTSPPMGPPAGKRCARWSVALPIGGRPIVAKRALLSDAPLQQSTTGASPGAGARSLFAGRLGMRACKMPLLGRHRIIFPSQHPAFACNNPLQGTTLSVRQLPSQFLPPPTLIDHNRDSIYFALTRQSAVRGNRGLIFEEAEFRTSQILYGRASHALKATSAQITADHQKPRAGFPTRGVLVCCGRYDAAIDRVTRQSNFGACHLRRRCGTRDDTISPVLIMPANGPVQSCHPATSEEDYRNKWNTRAIALKRSCQCACESARAFSCGNRPSQ